MADEFDRIVARLRREERRRRYYEPWTVGIALLLIIVVGWLILAGLVVSFVALLT